MSLKTAVFAVVLTVYALPVFATGNSDPSQPVCQADLDEQKREAELADRLSKLKPSAMPEDLFPGQSGTPNWGEPHDPYGYGTPTGYGSEFPGR